MGLRPLSNVLWAIGKLRLDLTKEQPLGPYLAEQLAGRIRRLVAAGALEVDMDASQLWYGMFFCQYPWPSEFLDELLDRSLPYLEVWGDVAVAEVRASGVAESRTFWTRVCCYRAGKCSFLQSYSHHCTYGPSFLLPCCSCATLRPDIL